MLSIGGGDVFVKGVKVLAGIEDLGRWYPESQLFVSVCSEKHSFTKF